MSKRPFRAAYIFFFLLFSDDTWRILAGFLLALLLGPLVVHQRNLSQGGEAVVWLMIMAIGWSISGWPAKKITGALKKAVKKAAE